MPIRPAKHRCACGAEVSQVAKQCLACRRKRVSVRCEVCGTGFECKPHKVKRTCSRQCADRLRAAGSSATQSRKVALVCEHCGRERMVSPTYSGRRFCSTKCRAARMVGENSPSWKGGITSEHQRFFSSPDWKLVCQSVWARDRRTCQRCGKVHERGEKLHEVHHVGSWAKFHDLRLELSNLALLCFDCHKFVHSRRNSGHEFIRNKH